MKALRRLVPCLLYKNTNIKEPNGIYVEQQTLIGEYQILKNELIDEISTNIYGANINKIYRISTSYNVLEKFLLPKINNDEDNISKYVIKINDNYFKILSIKNNWIDIEFL